MRSGIAVVCMTLACMFVTGCANMQSSRAPGADLSNLHTFYVQKLPDDDGSVVKIISDRLNAMGFQSTYGNEEYPAKETDSVVTYQDRWMWDITMYMLRLTIQIRDGKSRAILASAESYRPSLQRKSPEGMAEEVLNEIFNKKDDEAKK